jgi:hypothetical protein
MSLLRTVEHRKVFSKEEQLQIDDIVAYMHKMLDPDFFDDEDTSLDDIDTQNLPIDKISKN